MGPLLEGVFLSLRGEIGKVKNPCLRLPGITGLLHRGLGLPPGHLLVQTANLPPDNIPGGVHIPGSIQGRHVCDVHHSDE